MGMVCDLVYTKVIYPRSRPQNNQRHPLRLVPSLFAAMVPILKAPIQIYIFLIEVPLTRGEMLHPSRMKFKSWVCIVGFNPTQVACGVFIHRTWNSLCYSVDITLFP